MSREDRVAMSVEIGGRSVGPGEPCFVIAEAGVNHNGDLDIARRLIDVAVEAGADAVKFQTFNAARLVSADAPKADYQTQTTDPRESQLDMLQALELDAEAHRVLQAYCRQHETLFLSSPFDEESADLLAELDVPAYKLGSGEVTNWPLLRHVAAKGQPIILSTGMATLAEVGDAVHVLNDGGNRGLILLHCVTNYPADAGDANLLAMSTMATAFHVPVGYSDHTQGPAVPLAAVALGACVIEKHITLDRAMPGPDHQASAEPDEFKQLVAAIRDVERSLGSGIKQPAPSEAANRKVVRRSIASSRAIAEGTTITLDMLKMVRPASGLAPTLSQAVIGRRARHAIPADTLLSWEDLA